MSNMQSSLNELYINLAEAFLETEISRFMLYDEVEVSGYDENGKFISFNNIENIDHEGVVNLMTNKTKVLVIDHSINTFQLILDKIESLEEYELCSRIKRRLEILKYVKKNNY